MELREACCVAKAPGRACEDGWVLTADFAAVVDGSTAKGTLRPEGMTTGRLAMLTVCAALRGLPAGASVGEAARFLTRALRRRCRKLGIWEQALRRPEDRPTCVAVVVSRRRREAWLLGDCQLLAGGRLHSCPKPTDALLARARADALGWLMEQGRTVDELRADDVGRRLIFPALRDQCAFQNAGRDNPFRFTVLDGTPVDVGTVPVVSLRGCREVVLASDGYPRLLPRLGATERALSALLRADPLCTGPLMSTKCPAPGAFSYDDRTYLRLAL